MSSIYQKIFAHSYDSIMASVEVKLSKRRQDLLSPLVGNILDVGGGTGINLKFYNSEVDILLIDPSKEMIRKASKKFESKTNVTFIECGVNDEALKLRLKQKSLDYIVCTLVLCTIPDPNIALLNFKKWLKPNGRLIVLEHIHHNHAIHAKWQNAINPIWNKIGEGCNLNRKTDTLIKQNGFKVEKEAYFGSWIQFYQAIFSLNIKD